MIRYSFNLASGVPMKSNVMESHASRNISACATKKLRSLE